MKMVLLVAALLNFASYMWSVIGIFKKVQEMLGLEYRLLQICSLSIWVVASIEIYRRDVSTNVAIVLFAIQILCLVLFWSHTRIVKQNEFSIAFSKDQPVRLVELGLFRYLRHPFYFTYLLCYGSLSFGLLSLPLSVLTILMAGIYIRAARFEEGKFLAGPLGDAYRDYRKRTWMFFPKFF